MSRYWLVPELLVALVLTGLLGDCALLEARALAAEPVPAAAVLSVLRRQPLCWADRALDPGVKALQLEVVAASIAFASASPERAAYLITIGYHESRWCVAVGSGQKRGGGGEGYWQLEGRHHGPGARSGLSAVETASAAALASAQLDRSGQCGASPAAVLTAYAGRPCAQTGGWPTLESRVNGYLWALSALRRGRKP